MPIYSKSGNFIFVHIYKTGGTSLRFALKEQYPDIVVIDDEHSSMQDLAARYAIANRPYSFAVVRKPYDWLVSLYSYIKHEPAHPDYKLVSEIPFSFFLQWMIKQMKKPRQPGKVFYGRQCDFICSFHSTNRPKDILLSKFFKFEKLNEISDYFQEWPHIKNIQPFELPHLMKSERKKSWLSYYTEEDIKLVNQHFKLDFEIFDYKKL